MNPYKKLAIPLDASLMFYAKKDDITNVFHQDVNAMIGEKNKSMVIKFIK